MPHRQDCCTANRKAIKKHERDQLCRFIHMRSIKPKKRVARLAIRVRETSVHLHEKRLVTDFRHDNDRCKVEYKASAVPSLVISSVVVPSSRDVQVHAFVPPPKKVEPTQSEIVLKQVAESERLQIALPSPSSDSGMAMTIVAVGLSQATSNRVGSSARARGDSWHFTVNFEKGLLSFRDPLHLAK